MIKIYIKHNNIIIKGHADYDDIGKDIVCASVSSIVITSINACLKIYKDSISYEEGKTLRINILKEDKIIYTVLKNMLDMLEELEKSYKKNIKIIKEEEL